MTTGVQFPAWGVKGLLLFAIASIPTLELIQPPIHCVQGVLSPLVKLREAYHSLHLVPRLRMRGVTPPFPENVFMAWCLIKHRISHYIVVLS
jgi:hypothetical protein